MKLNLRNAIRFFFLFLIFALWFTGRGQNWGPLLGIGLLIIPLWGRIYCGWICPIYTTLDIMNPLLKEPQFNLDKSIFLNRYFQGLLVIIYGLMMVTFIKTNFFIPFFIFLIPAGIIVTYLFGEVFWHRFCFFGIIYSWFGNLARKAYTLDFNNCRKCNICVKGCSNGCIETNKEAYVLNKKHCLSCGKCQDSCPTSAISYRL